MDKYTNLQTVTCFDKRNQFACKGEYVDDWRRSQLIAMFFVIRMLVWY